MDKTICTAVNSLIRFYNKLCSRIENLENEVNQIVDLNSNPIFETVTTGTLTTDNIISDTATLDKLYIREICADDITAINITAVNIEGKVITSTSDKNKKNNISEINAEKLNKLNPVKYTFKGENDIKYGLIAQELEKIYPEMIFTNKNGEKSIEYNQLISLLIFKSNKLENKLFNLQIIISIIIILIIIYFIIKKL